VTFARTTKFVLTVALFAVAGAMVWVADLVNSTGPLFAGWVPLLIVPWVLTRPEEWVEPAPEEEARPENDTPTVPDGASDEEPNA
jgi:hypothetical protein